MADFMSTVAIEVVVRGMGNFNRGMMTLRRQMGLTGANAVKTRTQFGNLGAGITNTGQSVRNFGNQLLILGFQLTFLTAGPLAGVINQAAKFEQSMTKIITLVGVAEKQVGSWGDEILRISPDLGKGPRELADALFVITSAGIRDASEALDVLTNTAKASSIGLGEQKDVARAVTSALNTYGQEGLTAARATDILIATVREGNFETESLAPSLGRVISLAQQMGISFAEVGAFIATFTRLGVPAEVAVTSLRGAITNMIKPTAKAKEALESVGLSMNDIRATIEEKGLAFALIQLATILEGDSEAFARVFGNIRGLSGVMAVASTLTEDYVRNLRSIENSVGLTETAFERFTQTTQFMAQRAKASLEVLAVTVGSVLLPGVNALLDRIVPLAEAIGRFAENNQQIVLVAGAFAALVTAIGPLLIIVGLMISSFGTLITAIGAFVGLFSAFLAPIGALLGLLASAIPVLGTIGAVLGVISSGLTLIIPILGLFAAALVAAFILSLKKIRERLREEGTTLGQEAWKWGRNIIIQLARGMASAVSAVLRVLTQLAIEIAKLLGPGSPPAILPNLPEWGANAMNEFLQGWLEADFSIFNDIASVLTSFIRSLALPEDEVVPTILRIRRAIQNLVDQFSSAGDVTQRAIDRVVRSVGRSSGAIRSYVRAMIDMAIATKAVEEAQDELNRIQEEFAERLKPIDDELKAIADRRQEVVFSFRQAELEEILADPRSTPLARELALLELREIELKKQKNTIEDERDVELELARARLEAAEADQEAARERLEAARSLIEFITEENNLMREQEEILKRLAEAAGGVEDAFEGIGGAIPGDLSDLFPEEPGVSEDQARADLEDALDRIRNPAAFITPFDRLKRELAELGAEIAEIFRPITEEEGLLAQFTDAWSKVFSDAILQIDTEGLAPVLGELLRATLIAALKLSFKGSPERRQALSEGIDKLAEDIGALIAFSFEVIVAAPIAEFFEETLPGLVQAPGEFFKSIDDMIKGFLGLEDTIGGASPGDGTLGAFFSFGQFLEGAFKQALEDPHAFITDFLAPTFKQTLKDAVEETRSKFDEVKRFLNDQWSKAVTRVRDFVLQDLVPGFDDLVAKLTGDDDFSLLSALTSVGDFIENTLTGIFNFFRDNVLTPLGETVDGLAEQIRVLVSRVISLIQNIPGLRNLIPPDWLGESPSPFERSITGISEAMQQLAHMDLPDLAASVNANLGPQPMAPVSRAQAMQQTNTVNMGGQNINNGIDMILLQVALEQALKNVLQ